MAMTMPKVIAPTISSVWIARVMPETMKLLRKSSTALMSGMPGTRKSAQEISGYQFIVPVRNCVAQANIVVANEVMAMTAYVLKA